MKFKICFLSAALLFALVTPNVRAQDISDEDTTQFVSGNDCVPPVPEIGYRPSVYECNGNAAILMRGSFRNAYSVVLRRVGEFNDRDPQNTSCSTNRCSPYKVQKKIELGEYQVNCLGDTGYSSVIALATRISVKFTASLSNSLDPSQFQQYCLNSKTSDLN